MQSIEIAAPSDVIFDLIHDYSRRLTWDPFLKSASLVDCAVAETGAVAHCVAHNGFAMDTVYVSFNRPSVAAVKMVSGGARASSPAVIGRPVRSRSRSRKLSPGETPADCGRDVRAPSRLNARTPQQLAPNVTTLTPLRDLPHRPS